MIVRIHDISAACPRCGNAEFEQVNGEPLRLRASCAAPACGATTRYLALLNQIGEEAMRRANRAIENLKKKRPR